MTIDDVITEWEQDCELTVHVGDDQRASPKLHAKWLRRLMAAKAVRRKLKDQLEETTARKKMYYLGQADADVYKAKPFHHQVSTRDLPRWLEADDDLRRLRRVDEECGDMIDALREIIEMVKQRVWQGRVILDDMKHKAGA